jgi:hypothetical protein
MSILSYNLDNTPKPLPREKALSFFQTNSVRIQHGTCTTRNLDILPIKSERITHVQLP